MIVKTLKLLFNRDLEKLKTEIESYQDEKNLWRTDDNIKNSGGNLCLHLIGNLNTYIGVALAKTDYVRQRDLEFSLKDIPKAILIQKIEATMLVVEHGLDSLTPEQMSDDFPMVIWEKPSETEYTVIHLLTHLNYHLGQINYHRRLLDK
jgi:hypothetical protein